MQLALKYILSLFIIYSRAYYVNTPRSLVFVKMPKRKRLRLLTKKVVVSVYDYSKNLAGINIPKISETTPIS